ncbi:MAG: (E)-4-hydroxy-3-methylbut-2-enyl-diphosphate synthase [Pseudomonadota bacterium]|jgi:(E)-4-hydroxy-3-methylbut-2-enyl-diphosphate synthase
MTELVGINSIPKITRRPTRSVRVRDLIIGSQGPISVQSMCATKTQDIEATSRQIRLLQDHGADVIRIAIDSRRDVEALAQIRARTDARLVVDLQESYKLAGAVAPYVQKIRYNPGHLYHHEKDTPVVEKVKYIVGVARQHDLALRIGVNFGSLDPAQAAKEEDPIEVALTSAREHIGYLEDLGFQNYVVSLKSSDPNDVVDINTRFAKEFPDIPLHLGVTEAGMLPMGEIKTRVAFENLLARGIGDTLRVSLTLPHAEKHQEILVAKKIIEDVYAGRFRSVPRFEHSGLNIISCPSCSRVENEAFVELAQKVRAMTSEFAEKKLTIAVMGCRVNGPGETDDADLGLWCAPNHVNLKKGQTLLGQFSYQEIVSVLQMEMAKIVAERGL